MAKATKKRSGSKSGHPARVTKKVVRRPAKVTARDWISGARLRTLPLAVAPVAIGAGLASMYPKGADWLLIGLCLAVAVFLQIGVNYANDYSDGIRGTDDFRVGPARLTASGGVNPKAVLRVALIFFGLAAAAGLAITVLTGLWWLLAVGAVAIVAAWFYTGGKRPYGYNALGELFVFVFFGLVATLGTMFVLVREITAEGWILASSIGLIACAVLMANNLRDVDQDRESGKRTLAVLIGRTAGRVVFIVMVLLPYVAVWFFSLLFPLMPLMFFSLILTVPACVIVATAKTPREYIIALQLTSLYALVFGLGTAAALAF